MATTTLTPHQRAKRSTVQAKVIMAITGLIMICFLLMHMAGNLKMFLGQDEFNGYAEWLKGDIFAPLFPPGSFIWVFRIVMLLAIVLHIHSARILAVRDHAARPEKYQNQKRLAQTYAARTMRWGGVIILLFVIFHLLQFTIKAITPGFSASDAPYKMFVLTFQQPLMVIIYIIAMVAVCMHVRHAVWSSFATLGCNTSKLAANVLNAVAMIVAVVLFIGFLSAPLAVCFGWIH